MGWGGRENGFASRLGGDLKDRQTMTDSYKLMGETAPI